MARKSFTESAWRTDPWFRNLCKAILSCKTEQRAADFLRDIGTLMELQAWSERFEIASRIAEGQTYRAITKGTGASTTTVTRVASFLFDGEGGYRKALNVKNHHHADAHGHHHGRQKLREKRMASVA